MKNYDKNILEALFFLKGEEGINLEYLSLFLEISEEAAKKILNDFLENYNENSSSLIIKKYGSTYKMLVRDDIYKVIKLKLSEKKLTKLSKVALETLSIIAYKQPISKLEIDDIRGVNSESIINNLLERELIVSNKVLDKIGKPKLYETTDLFLDLLGIESLEELPQLNDNEANNNYLENDIDEFLNQ